MQNVQHGICERLMRVQHPIKDVLRTSEPQWMLQTTFPER